MYEVCVFRVNVIKKKKSALKNDVTLEKEQRLSPKPSQKDRNRAKNATPVSLSDCGGKSGKVSHPSQIFKTSVESGLRKHHCSSKQS